MKSWKDHLLTGLLLGLLVPVVSLYIYCKLRFTEMKFIEMIKSFDARNVLSHVVSLSVISNLLLFFIFIWLQKDRSAKGVLGATIIFALLILFLKFRK